MDPKNVLVHVQDFLRNDVEEAGPGKHELKRADLLPQDEFYSDIRKLYDGPKLAKQQKSQANQFPFEKAELLINSARRQIDNIYRIIGYSLDKKIVSIQKISPSSQQSSSPTDLSSQQLATLLMAKKRQFRKALEILSLGSDRISRKSLRNSLCMKQLEEIHKLFKVNLAPSSVSAMFPRKTVGGDQLLTVDVTPSGMQVGGGKQPLSILSSSETGLSLFNTEYPSISSEFDSLSVLEKLKLLQRDCFLRFVFRQLTLSCAKVSKRYKTFVHDNRVVIEIDHEHSISVSRVKYPSPELLVEGMDELRCIEISQFLLKSSLLLSHQGVNADNDSSPNLVHELVDRVVHHKLREQLFSLVSTLRASFPLSVQFQKKSDALKLEVVITLTLEKERRSSSFIVLLDHSTFSVLACDSLSSYRLFPGYRGLCAYLRKSLVESSSPSL